MGLSMFALSRRSDTRALSAPRGVELPPSYLRSSLRIRGVLEAECELTVGGVVIGRIAALKLVIAPGGHVEGDISCASLVQGPDSRITGHIVAQSARLAGLVDGSITAQDLVVESSAQITGDIRYERITIEAGSRVDGRFAHHNPAGSTGELKLIA